MDNIEEKIKNLEEWKEERARVKPYIDIAVDYHNRARIEAHWKDYEGAAHLYREAIENYRNAVAQNPKYYLQDLLDRIDHVLEEYINNTFNLKTHGDRLKTEHGARDFVNFIDNLKQEERKYIDTYDIVRAYLCIANFYYGINKFDKALEFYNRIIGIQCNRPFVNQEVYFKTGKILFGHGKFKEALMSFISALSFERDNREVILCVEDCLNRLGISQYSSKFLRATPNEAKKLIMEVL